MFSKKRRGEVLKRLPHFASSYDVRSPLHLPAALNQLKVVGIGFVTYFNVFHINDTLIVLHPAIMRSFHHNWLRTFQLRSLIF